MSAPDHDARFRTLRPLGRGGTAEVTAVYVNDLKIEAAYKAPLPDSPDLTSQFRILALRESALIGREAFPGLVRFLEVPNADASYILLEICNGPSLERVGRIDDPALAMNLLSAMALDLEFLHSRGIIHGDIKPHNFFLPSDWKNCRDGRLFYVKLSDFSMGRFVNEDESARSGAGTVGYMAPETILQGTTSYRSDLFALGVTAYQMLTGHHPFIEEDAEPVRVNARVAEEEPRSLAELRPDLPPALVELVDNLLAKRESDRPVCGFDVCRKLEEAGCRFPYRKALRPSHLLRTGGSYDDVFTTCLQVTPIQRERLDILTGRDLSALRLLLSINFNRGSLQYGDRHLTFAGDIYWPTRMRRAVLDSFSRLSFVARRQAVIAAVAARAGLPADSETGPAVTSALASLLLPMLHPRTVRRVSKRLASRVQQTGAPAPSAMLHIMAGNLERAEQCAYDSAESLRAGNKTDEALRCLTNVISYARLTDRLFEVRQLLMMQGDIFKEKGESENAHRTYAELIALYEGNPPDKLLAETYKDLGDLAKMKHDFQTGIEALEQALRIYRQLDDELEVSHTLNNLGNIHWINADLNAASRNYREALRIQHRLKAQGDVASTMSNLASIYAIRSRLPRCIQLLKLALAIQKEAGDAGQIARTLNNLGYANYISGKMEASYEALHEALTLNRQIGNKKEILFNLDNLTAAALLLGRLKESVTYINEGLALASDLQDKPHLATFHLITATVYGRMGRFVDAQQSLMSARSFFDQISSHPLEPLYLSQQAGLKHALGTPDQALRIGAEAAHRARELGDRYIELQTLLVVCRVTDDPAWLDTARSIIKDLRLVREKVLIEFCEIERLLERQEYSTAHDVCARSLPALEAMVEDIELPRLCNLAAEVMIACGQTENASTWLERGLRAARQSGLVLEAAETLTLQTRLSSLNGDYETSYARSRQALQIFKQLAENLNDNEERTAFLGRRLVKYLVDEVGRLKEKMAQKQRAE